jgi:hypothetical protein
MHGTTTTQFNCVNCNALYHLIKAEAGPETVDRELPCRVCGTPLPSRQGNSSSSTFFCRNQAHAGLETLSGKLRPALSRWQDRMAGTHRQCRAEKRRPTYGPWPSGWLRGSDNPHLEAARPLHHSSRPADRASAHKARARAPMTAQSRSWKSPDRKGARSPAVVSGRTTK